MYTLRNSETLVRTGGNTKGLDEMIEQNKPEQNNPQQNKPGMQGQKMHDEQNQNPSEKQKADEAAKKTGNEPQASKQTGPAKR